MFLLKQRQQQFQPNIYLPPVIAEQKEKEEAQFNKKTSTDIKGAAHAEQYHSWLKMFIDADNNKEDLGLNLSSTEVKAIFTLAEVNQDGEVYYTEFVSA